jgi:very-short-patch-repair endonuclease
VQYRHRDLFLQTQFDKDALESRLLRIYYDASTLEEEQGVNVLYIALGLLRWFEDKASDKARFAPLLLIPVTLDRKSAGARFTVAARDEDLETNLSLKEKLADAFDLALPELPDPEDLVPTSYFASVRAAVSERDARWSVLDDAMLLGFFSFAKLLMYRDLEPARWPSNVPLHRVRSIRSVLGCGFENTRVMFSDGVSLDSQLHPKDLFHVLDADSSQAIVIEEARRGRSLVVQGPPGTGKSQTIANIIATCARDGKRVLFVAEKMVALEAVKSRLDQAGLGPLCLELHSSKANKRAVLEDLGSTLELGRPKRQDADTLCRDLVRQRDALNAHAAQMHTPFGKSGVTPYKLIGRMARLRSEGVDTIPFTVDEARTWDESDLTEKQEILAVLAKHARTIGVPSLHPWRGVGLQGAILPPDVQRLLGRLEALAQSLQEHIAAADGLARAIKSAPSPHTVSSVQRSAQVAAHLSAAPVLRHRPFADAVWTKDVDTIARVVAEGSSLVAARASLGEVVAETAWSTDLLATREAFATQGRSWLRAFLGPYRRACTTLRTIVRAQPPRRLAERIRLLDSVIEVQMRTTQLEGPSDAASLGSTAFGELWQGPGSDWQLLANTVEWARGARDKGLPMGHILELAAEDPDPGVLAALAQTASQTAARVEAELAQAIGDLVFDPRGVLGHADLDRAPLEALCGVVNGWLAAPEGLSQWVAFKRCHARATEAGLAVVADHVMNGTVPPMHAVAALEMGYCEAMLREVAKQFPSLLATDGISQTEIQERFRNLDGQMTTLARQEVAAMHWSGLPESDGDAGDMGTIRREIAKKRRHMPLRKLLAETGRTIQKIKPVFMMSPLSVARFLKPGSVDFDVLLMDEASQIRPVDALGAFARANQVVVVGDKCQLPPTSFFDRVVSENDGDNEDNVAADVDSVLELCEARGLPRRMLRWHYRSRHHSLIAVSNREVYESRLYVVPSAAEAHDEMGVRFRLIEKAVYDRGGSAKNIVEADAVAHAVMDHARRCPHKSLGVGTFSVAQREAIQAALERLRKGDDATEDFFSTGKPERFLVKNLENIQGDERDVIFISVGYGRDSDGRMSASFGPVSADGGERRLNVLISRAKELCVVFSSITDEDINLQKAHAKGARLLKTFLRYARTGSLDVAAATDRDYDSDFEREVATALRSPGYTVDPQIGSKGFFVDLGVRDPDKPGRYLLGIECDGAQYHSSVWARDRDRIRQEVLEQHGWTIHRIWSTDWFHRPVEQLRKAIAAIENARALAARPPTASIPPEPAAADVVEREASGPSSVEEPADSSPDQARRCVGASTTGYVEANFPISAAVAIHEMPTADLAGIVRRVVEIEGPVHGEEIARRVADLWGLKRTGNRITGAVDRALSRLTRTAACARDGSFYCSADLARIVVRDRSQVQSATLRRPDYLPPSEIREAILDVVGQNPGVPTASVIQCAARLFGFKSTSRGLADAIGRQLERLTQARSVVVREGRLHLPDA